MISRCFSQTARNRAIGLESLGRVASA
jgi:hypothetical protein